MAKQRKLIPNGLGAKFWLKIMSGFERREWEGVNSDL